MEEFRSWVKMMRENYILSSRFKKAPDQNRTDTSSLEGYGSTIELQAHFYKTPHYGGISKKITSVFISTTIFSSRKKTCEVYYRGIAK